VKATTLTLGTYDVVVTNSVASVTSSPAELSLQSTSFSLGTEVIVFPAQ